MRFISTKTHALLDYTVGVLLIAAPWLLGFNDGTVAQWVPQVNGIAVIIMSILTNYEGGLIKNIPMRAHLGVDVLAGIILAVSPWLFGFSERIFLPHLIVGVFEVMAGFCTKTLPYTTTNKPHITSKTWK